MSEHKNGDILAAFLIGGVVGAILGILFAPASGRVTRERIGDWLEEKKEHTKEALEKLEEEIKKRKEQLTK